MTNHWAAVVNHIGEYDKEMIKRDKVNKWIINVDHSKQLEKQMELRKQNLEELRLKEKETDKQNLEYNLCGNQNENTKHKVNFV